jgi:hypothetical protein
VGQKLQVLPFKMQHGNAGRRRPSYVDPSFLSFNYLLHAANTRKGYNATTEEQIEILRSASEEFRARLERTLEPHILAEEYGFL